MPAGAIMIPFPEEHLILIRSISYFLSFTLIALIILLYQKLAENKEKLLLDANEDLKRKTEELTELNVTKDKFFSILAHDLKNPFSSVLKGLELVTMNYRRHNDEKRIMLLDAIHKTALSTYELLEKLLEWGKIKTGRLQPQFDNIEINEIVLEVIDLYDKLIIDKSLTITIDLEKNLLVYADQSMLSVIVRNLISNAIKFTPNKGNIKVLSEPGENGFVDIVFVDSGVGISEKNQKELFTTDINYSNPGTENEKGTGLGLHLCKEYVEKISGEISVSSKPGVGSRFTISLRRACE
jgi:signal transduction histidine kinase